MMRELKCPLFSFKIAWTVLDFSCTVQAINYSVSIDWSRKNTGKKKVTTEERKLPYWVRMIDGDGGDQCRISNLSKEQIQFSSAVSQVVMYCCGAVPRIEF